MCVWLFSPLPISYFLSIFLKVHFSYLHFQWFNVASTATTKRYSQEIKQNANWWWENFVLLSVICSRNTAAKKERGEQVEQSKVVIGACSRAPIHTHICTVSTYPPNSVLSERSNCDTHTPLISPWFVVSKQSHLMLYAHATELYSRGTNYVMKLFETMGLMTSSVSSVSYQINVHGYITLHALLHFYTVYRTECTETLETRCAKIPILMRSFFHRWVP